MSSQLENKASFQASFFGNFWKQTCFSVPPIPADIDLVGKTALVTGSNTGLGLACARHFLKLRPHLLVMAVRSVQKGEAAAAGLRTEFPRAMIEIWELDMESNRSIQAFAARCERELDRLHVAVLNAGVGKMKFERVEEGGRREKTIQVNYLGTALLALLLLPKMRSSSSTDPLGPGRLSIITSDAALGTKIDCADQTNLLDSLDRPEGFDGFTQYSRSKLLITMFCARLAEAVDPDDIIVNCCNPGPVKSTDFLSNVDSWVIKAVFGFLHAIMGRTVIDGARIYVHSALVLGQESHGSFTDWTIRAWPVTMYSVLGRHISGKLWSETVEELRFARVDELLEDLKEEGAIALGKK